MTLIIAPSHRHAKNYAQFHQLVPWRYVTDAHGLRGYDVLEADVLILDLGAIDYERRRAVGYAHERGFRVQVGRT